MDAQKEEEKTVEKVYFKKLNSILGYVKRNFVIIYYLQIALVPACFAFDVNKCIEMCILCKYRYFVPFGIKNNLNISIKTNRSW